MDFGKVIFDKWVIPEKGGGSRQKNVFFLKKQYLLSIEKKRDIWQLYWTIFK